MKHRLVIVGMQVGFLGEQGVGLSCRIQRSLEEDIRSVGIPQIEFVRSHIGTSEGVPVSVAVLEGAEVRFDFRLPVLPRLCMV